MDLGKNLQNNEKQELNLKKLLNGRTIISAMTDSGKSWTVRKICEEIYGKIGIIILDPEGEYYSLREKYPFLIVGKDIPLEVDSAEYLAEEILKSNISAIFDFSLIDTIDQQQFTSRFINKFMDLQTKLKKSYLVVVEEADEFAPEKGTFKSESLRSIINIAKKGRKRNIGLILATQRPAFVSKFVISQCQNKIIGRTEWTGDLKVIKDFLQIKDSIIDKISKLNQGEFFISGGLISNDSFIKIGNIQTTHAGETPEISPPKTTQLKSIIEKISKSLPKIIEPEIQQNIPIKKISKDIELKYKKNIYNLENELKKSKALEISEEEIQNRIEKEIDSYKGKFQEQEIELHKLKKFIGSIIAKARQIVDGEVIKSYSEENTNIPIELNYGVWLDKFKGGNKRVLELMIKHGKLTKSQIQIMSGLAKSNLNVHIFPKLRKAGLINYDSENVRLINK